MEKTTITDRLKSASKMLAKAIHAIESGNIDFILFGWHLGIAYQELKEAIAITEDNVILCRTLIQESEQKAIKELLINEICGRLMKAAFLVTDEDEVIQLLKLGWELGRIAQTIVNLTVCLEKNNSVTNYAEKVKTEVLRQF